MNLRQLMTAQPHVVKNHFVCQSNQGDRPQHNARTLDSRIWDFMRMKHPTFHETKVDEDRQGFTDEILKVVDAIVTPK